MLLQEFWDDRYVGYCERLREVTRVGYESAWRCHVEPVFGGNTTFILYGEHTGRVVMLGNPNNAYAGCTGVWRTADPMPAA